MRGHPRRVVFVSARQSYPGVPQPGPMGGNAGKSGETPPISENFNDVHHLKCLLVSWDILNSEIGAKNWGQALDTGIELGNTSVV